jgi:oxalate decarboxylase
MTNPFLFDLAKSAPTVKKPEGTVQGAYQKNFPIVTGRNGAMFLVVLEPKGIREPHWHPDAWEFDYCISGHARMAVVAPNNKWETFEVRPGQVVFIPQGYFHYFENIGAEQLRFLVVFNSSEAEHDDDIGISVSRTGIPDHVLAKTFGVAIEDFVRIPKPQQEPLIV